MIQDYGNDRRNAVKRLQTFGSQTAQSTPGRTLPWNGRGRRAVMRGHLSESCKPADHGFEGNTGSAGSGRITSLWACICSVLSSVLRPPRSWLTMAVHRSIRRFALVRFSCLSCSRALSLPLSRPLFYAHSGTKLPKTSAWPFFAYNFANNYSAATIKNTN